MWERRVLYYVRRERKRGKGKGKRGAKIGRKWRGGMVERVEYCTILYSTYYTLLTLLLLPTLGRQKNDVCMHT